MVSVVILPRQEKCFRFIQKAASKGNWVLPRFVERGLHRSKTPASHKPALPAPLGSYDAFIFIFADTTSEIRQPPAR